MKTIAVLVATVGIAFSPASSDAHFYRHCRTRHCKRHVVRPFKTRLLSIAWCESRRHWHIHGAFDGGMQFGWSTWPRTGSRYSHAYLAPPIEQMYRAVIWSSMIGWAWHSTAGWPVCG